MSKPREAARRAAETVRSDRGSIIATEIILAAITSCTAPLERERDSLRQQLAIVTAERDILDRQVQLGAEQYTVLVKERDEAKRARSSYAIGMRDADLKRIEELAAERDSARAKVSELIAVLTLARQTLDDATVHPRTSTPSTQFSTNPHQPRHE